MKINIIDISDNEVSIGTSKALPVWEDIPEKFKHSCQHDCKWKILFYIWSIYGISNINLTAKEDIDYDKSIRMISAHITSKEPSKDHKAAGVSYMMSELLENYSFLED